MKNKSQKNDRSQEQIFLSQPTAPLVEPPPFNPETPWDDGFAFKPQITVPNKMMPLQKGVLWDNCRGMKMLFLLVAVTQILPNPQFSQEGMHYDYNAIAFKTIKEMKEACTQYGTKDNKTFLSHQCKEIVENNRMGKNRNLFKNIRDTKGTFHAKMSSI